MLAVNATQPNSSGKGHNFAALADMAYKKPNLKTALSDFVHH
jgi:hypothetical protein